MTFDETELLNNESIHNFEWWIDGQRAFIEYKRKGDTVYLIHTEVPQKLAGQGVAAALVEKTFAYLEKKHLNLAPLCSYVQHYLEKHPAWNRLLVD